MKLTITAAAALSFAVGLAVAAPAGADEVYAARYATDFSDVAVNDGSGWRMSGNYDAQITDGALRITNARTSGSFGDQLFSPELPVGAVEGSDVNTFTAKFTLKPVALQPGLRITVSPDNGSGGRAGFLAIEHRADGLALVTSGSFFTASGTLDWERIDVATGLDPQVEHTVHMKLIKKPDTKKTANNDVFSVKVDGKPVKNTTFEAYYDATGEPQYETDTLLFRLSGTAVAAMATSQGMLIDDLMLAVE